MEAEKSEAIQLVVDEQNNIVGSRVVQPEHGEKSEGTDKKVLSGLRKAARDAITSANSALKKYWELLVYIRDNQIPPPVVTAELKEAGFALPRIAEVKRVAFSDAKIFEAYRANVIGFRLALQKARDENPKKKKQARTSAQDLFEKAVRIAVEDTIPLAGRFPAWAKRITLEAQGCEVVITITRKAE